MKTLILMLTVVIFTQTALAEERPLSASEIQTLFEQLCQEPSTRWIEQGRLESLHQSYDASSGRTTHLTETVTSDGNRFVWQLRIDSVTQNGQAIPEDEQETIKRNQDRLFAWDGQTYTLYFKSGNQAITYENPEIPVKVTGPLTAGYIPWGYGVFTLDTLMNADVSAFYSPAEQSEHIQLTLQIPERAEMQFVLDPEKEYAVRSYTQLYSEDLKTVYTYGNYVQLHNRFIPMNILIERFNNSQLLTSEYWEILSIEDSPVQNEMFQVQLQDQTLVEHHTPLLDKPAYYRHSSRKDIKPLLDERLMAGLKKGLRKQNCGTVAAEHILNAFGVEVSDQELVSLVNSVSGRTSLYQIHKYIEQKGLYSAPLKTNLKGLQKFDHCRVLIHFPKIKHFVILDRFDSNLVWIVDLDRRTFYQCLSIDEFKQRWAGIALIVSTQPLSLAQDDILIPENILKNIIGSADYSCSKLIQEGHIDYCPEMILGTCKGRYTLWEERYACQVDTEGGFCSGTGMIGSIYSPCIEEISNPGQCDSNGEYISRYLRACLP